jgi:hypothetical protein
MKTQLNWNGYQRTPASLASTLQTKRHQLGSALNNWWQSLLAYSSASSEPHVWQTEDSTGQTVWNAYDPLRRQLIEQVSTQEMLIWLEERHYQNS